MKIALICDWYAPRRGGIEAHLAGLASHLADRGHAVHVVTSTAGSTDSHVSGVTIHRLGAPTLPFAGVVFQPSAIRSIGDILVREHIDVAHAHVSIVAPVGIGGALEAQRLRLPTVVTFHSFIPFTPFWAGLVGNLVGASHWGAVMSAVSGRVVREVRAFAPGSCFRILPNAVDADFWTPSEKPAPDNPVLLLAAGRLQSKKRPMMLIDALGDIRRNAPNVDVRLRIAGSGPLEPALRKAVEREHLSDSVEFVGWKNRDQLRDLVRESHVFLAPAARESFGLAALEARSAGVPVVALRDSAIADFIAHEQSGLLADDGPGFARAATRIVRDTDLRQRLANHNRTTSPNLGWGSAIDQHEDAYAEARAMASDFQLPTR